jgi:hypothetical protein
LDFKSFFKAILTNLFLESFALKPRLVWIETIRVEQKQSKFIFLDETKSLNKKESKINVMHEIVFERQMFPFHIFYKTNLKRSNDKQKDINRRSSMLTSAKKKNFISCFYLLQSLMFFFRWLSSCENNTNQFIVTLSYTKYLQQKILLETLDGGYLRIKLL